MYQFNDTIVAVSSPRAEQRAIVRISGPGTLDALRRIFRPSIPEEGNAVIAGSLTIEPELRIDAKLYLFLGPYSYTGETIAEIHFYTNPALTEALLSELLRGGLRMAGPGEFTARAYLNGRMDLTQAEAVNEVVVSSNRLQLAASEKLLAGRLAETTAKACADILDCASLVEAGLDFSGEDIEFVPRPELVERLTGVKNELEQLLSGSISYEEVADLPSVGIAGAPNAGKSSLLNKMLGATRSIVSERRKTTRDVLTGQHMLRHGRCVFFDCAGLVLSPKDILDELSQRSAAEALRNSSVVVFCVDAAKTDYSEDTAVRELIEARVLVAVATKSDLLAGDILADRILMLNELFGAVFVPTSSKTGAGLESLRELIDKKIVELTRGAAGPSTAVGSEGPQSWVALTARHRQAVVEAVADIGESISELKKDDDEVAAMMLRAAYQSLSRIEQPSIDEQILERIFGRFCIGK
ncbi:MAG: tRNA modification GTPase [Planctomycetota bacterium]